ncbi:hypothetical protein SWQG_00047 [Synechococcus phage S-RIP2]|jgi:hypothetical protein|uniref:Uncharacterized protein n=2 Tax=Sednavirus SRIP2 TaxID=2733955 RepID=M4SNY7_9CAUD|nr:hypothetical protein SWQG_00047 [Synechococcus phage S-RIP2]YP_007676345.1 hypothetical protein CYZG_00023 [Cyanophage KBS-P-1A]AGG91341.1 hypothetical protein SWQG_00047 [Synechococcus phage S-RIP2]AGH57718.1 hypothetical protein CYZG_00023 [Cyanophage KBS-P-1A]
MCTLLGLVVVGLVQTGPGVFTVELLTETGDILEYVLIENDKNLSSHITL